MRQIEDRWRINHRDPPNTSENYANLLANFQFNPSQLFDIKNYSNNSFRNYRSSRCTNICIQAKNLDFKNCLQSCDVKLLKSQNIFDKELEVFDNEAKLKGDKLFQY